MGYLLRMPEFPSSLVSAGLCLAALFGMACSPSPAERDGDSSILKLKTWQARVVPETLTIFARAGDAGREMQIATGRKTYSVKNLKTSGEGLSWTIPDLGMNIEIAPDGDRLRARFVADRELKFEWALGGRDPAMRALIYPDGEGLYIPLDDAFWLDRLVPGYCRDTHGGLSMPFWSYQAGERTVSYLAASDLQTELCFSRQGERLATYAVHDFRQRDGLPPYEILLWMGGASPVSPAQEYKQWLKESGRFVTLKEKIAANPEAAKLLGAMHAYLYGDGRTPEFLQELGGLGIDRFWLGYDQNPEADRYAADGKFIQKAEGLGFLVGPYDSFTNIQNPKTADSPNARWDLDLYRTGCVINADGKPRTGFAGRGCELSSEALERAEPERHYIENRVKKFVSTGMNSYFLDCDGFGELLDDYSPDHPMTPRKDRLNRLKRLRYISQDQKMVLGSEGVVGWATPVVHFSHGTLAVYNDILWPLTRDRKAFGGWWPPERPGIFFKPVKVTPDFARAKYDPRYRLPLFEAAFHESIVVTDRWELGLAKMPQLIQTRTLMELLYNVPSIWSFDRRELRQHAKRLRAHYRFFSPLHRSVGDKPLADFRWLTADRLVQQTRFADTLRLTANFSDQAFESVSPRCIQAEWLKEDRSETFCPEP